MKAALTESWWNAGVDPSRDLVAELDALIAETSSGMTPEQAEALVIARLRAAEQLDASPTTRPDPGTEPFAVADGLPEVRGSELDAASLARALHHHGALVVRQLLPTEHVKSLRADLDQMIEARRVAIDAGTAYRTLGRIGNCQASESPPVLARLLDILQGSGLVDAVKTYFGTRPVVVAERVRLRRDRLGLPWHQDAAFFGGTFEAVNAWIALTPAGVDRDGLAIIPRRVDDIIGRTDEYPTLRYGADVFTPEVVESLSAGGPVATPAFEPGDALLFDEMTVHRTASMQGRAPARDVAVAWFFSPDRIPRERGRGQWAPLAV